MNRDEKLGMFLIVILGVIALGLYLHWVNGRDEKIMKAGTEYENCIKEQYHQTPADYHVTNGTYPECKK